MYIYIPIYTCLYQVLYNKTHYKGAHCKSLPEVLVVLGGGLPHLYGCRYVLCSPLVQTSCPESLYCKTDCKQIFSIEYRAGTGTAHNK